MYDTIEKARAMRDLLEEACFEFGDGVLEGVFRRAEVGEGIRATEGGDSLVERSAHNAFPNGLARRRKQRTVLFFDNPKERIFRI